MARETDHEVILRIMEKYDVTCEKIPEEVEVHFIMMISKGPEKKLPRDTILLGGKVNLCVGTQQIIIVILDS